MAQNPLISRCLSLLRSGASELVKVRQRSRKTGHTLASVDVLEDRVLLTSDFGDAPAPYPVTQASDGARHEVGGPTLGLTIDSEADGANSSLAAGDGADEDGVVFGAVNAGRTDASVIVKVRNAALGGRVDAWVDFNGNGSWSDPGEQIVNSAAVTNTTDRRFTFSVPADAVLGTTYARVRISTAGGLAPTGAAVDGEVEDHNVTIGLASPTLTAPAAAARVDVSGSYRVTFQWNEVPQAAAYEIWVRSHNYQAQDEFHRTIVPGTSYTPDLDFGIGNYSVWMRSLGTNNTMSTWSALRQFSTVAKPTITPMARMQPTSRPTITWDPVLGAESYKVWISNLSTGKSPVILQEGLTTPSFTPVSSLPLGVYRIWVSAWSGGKSGGWSTPIDLQIAPAPVQNDTTPTMLGEKFSWSSVQGATSYEFQLKNMKTNELTLNISVQGTSLNQVPVLFSGTRYRWWVRAKSEQGVYSLWTGPKDFIAGGQTTILTPTGSTSNKTPLFTWLAVEGAVKYEMLLRRDDVNSLVLNKKDILTNSFTPASNLAAGNYRVWIRAINANGILTTWSVAQTFTITAVTPNEEQPAENFLAVSLLSDEPDDVNEIPVLIATTAPDSSPVIEDRPEDTPAELEAITGNEAPATSTVPESVENPIADLIDLAISAWTNRSVDQA
jgi:hypothetical protein